MTELKSFTPRLLQILMIGLPLLLASLYFTVFAADRYVSESTVALREAGNDAGALLPGAALLLAGLNPPSREDTLYLRQYIQSLGLLKVLQSKLDLRANYAAEKVDLLTRLSEGASQEQFLEYYRSRVEVKLDDQSSTLTVRVQGYDAAFAHRLNQEILTQCELFVNEMSHQLAREKLRFSETELARAAEQLQQARTEVLSFQERHKLLDPAVQARASGAMVAEMQAQITRMEADLRNLRSYLNDDAYQVKALRGQITATRAQLDLERVRTTGEDMDGSGPLNALTLDYQSLRQKAQFKLDTYKAALAATENARIDASRKLKSLVVIEPATQPETAEYPRRIYNLGTLLVVCLLIYGVTRLVLATIREHQD
jgi:capsular polysaccharide transport system permease protein